MGWSKSSCVFFVVAWSQKTVMTEMFPVVKIGSPDIFRQKLIIFLKRKILFNTLGFKNLIFKYWKDFPLWKTHHSFLEKVVPRVEIHRNNMCIHNFKKIFSPSGRKGGPSKNSKKIKKFFFEKKYQDYPFYRWGTRSRKIFAKNVFIKKIFLCTLFFWNTLYYKR